MRSLYVLLDIAYGDRGNHCRAQDGARRTSGTRTMNYEMTMMGWAGPHGVLAPTTDQAGSLVSFRMDG